MVDMCRRLRELRAVNCGSLSLSASELHCPALEEVNLFGARQLDAEGAAARSARACSMSHCLQACLPACDAHARVGPAAATTAPGIGGSSNHGNAHWSAQGWMRRRRPSQSAGASTSRAAPRCRACSCPKPPPCSRSGGGATRCQGPSCSPALRLGHALGAALLQWGACSFDPGLCPALRCFVP